MSTQSALQTSIFATLNSLLGGTGMASVPYFQGLCVLPVEKDLDWMLSSYNQAHYARCAGPQEVKLHALHDDWVLFQLLSGLHHQEGALGEDWRKRGSGEREECLLPSLTPQGGHQLAASLSQRQQLPAQCPHHILRYHMTGLYPTTGSTTPEKLPIFLHQTPRNVKVGTCSAFAKTQVLGFWLTLHRWWLSYLAPSVQPSSCQPEVQSTHTWELSVIILLRLLPSWSGFDQNCQGQNCRLRNSRRFPDNEAE